jgi:hypothetical protein
MSASTSVLESLELSVADSTLLESSSFRVSYHGILSFPSHIPHDGYTHRIISFRTFERSELNRAIELSHLRRELILADTDEDNTVTRINRDIHTHTHKRKCAAWYN